jgi:hypothetical protein
MTVSFLTNADTAPTHRREERTAPCRYVGLPALAGPEVRLPPHPQLLQDMRRSAVFRPTASSDAVQAGVPKPDRIMANAASVA